MSPQIKVTTTVKTTHTIDVNSQTYPNMTAEQAAEYERNLDEADRFEQVEMAIQATDGTAVDLQVDVEVL